MTVWKLHKDIPHRVSQPAVCPPATGQRNRLGEENDGEDGEINEDVQAVDPEERVRVVVSASTCVPATVQTYFTSFEMSLIDMDR